ncbi:TetR/AcrR family transcriptional regulator C-terminal domain-containing protein [Camelimonas lactis]|uniref:TetR/AcrR family transcriptional regulator C-terminal domain-containing protein n=1 Tax=Camelimonas lactis TaxID=659006 RepID=UPI00104BEEF3|nr:TetR/AcrR family transcriptional regulator C-terminal domain-containing protein [Camelimonas lactis]
MNQGPSRRLVFQELRTDPDYRSTRLFQLNQAYTQRIVDVVRSAQERHEFRREIAPALVRDMLFGCMEHRTWAFLRGEGDFDAPSLADEITDLICRSGALARAATGPEDGARQHLDRLERVAARLEAATASFENQIRSTGEKDTITKNK